MKPSTQTPAPSAPKKRLKRGCLWGLLLLLICLWFGLRGMTYQVGDYYDDGVKQGVVFEVDGLGFHGKIVSLDEAELQWCTEEDSNRKVQTGATDRDDGRNNQDLIEHIADWRTKYPAFAWCADQGEGWYLPAVEELRTIHLVEEKLNKTLTKMGGNTTQFDWYWSSSELNINTEICAWYVCMGNGYTNYNNKNTYYSVRAVSAF